MKRTAVALVVAAMIGFAAGPAAPIVGTTQVVGAPAGGPSHTFAGANSLSADGMRLVFDSGDPNLVPGDTNSQYDTFLRILPAGTIVRVSADGGDTASAAISEAGGHVVYMQACVVHLYVVATGARQAISPVGGCASPGPVVVSDGGTRVAFWFDANPVGDGKHLFVRDVTSGTLTQVDVTASGSPTAWTGLEGNPRIDITPDGRFVGFPSTAGDLVAGDGNGVTDVFVRDLVAGTTERISVDPSGGDADNYSWEPALTPNGRFIAFSSHASDLVTGDGNGTLDVFVRDLSADQTTRVSVDRLGADANAASTSPHVSDDGRFVTFWSQGTDLVADGVIDGNGALFGRDLLAPQHDSGRGGGPVERSQ